MRGIKAGLLAAASNTGALRLALRARQKRLPIILMYHGVTRDPQPSGLKNFEGKHIAVDLFAKHLRILKKNCKVISLQTMVDGLYSQEDLSGTIALTFDDGYENNLLNAAPVLTDFKMPATFFLTTSLIDSDHFIWPDRVEMLVDRTERTSVKLPGGGGALPLRTLEERQHALVTIKRFLKKQSMDNLDQTLEELTHQLNVPDKIAEGDYRFMSWEQVRTLVRTGFEVGAHTVTHPILTKIPLGVAKQEIVGSRDTLVEKVGQCSSTFCYPNGKSDDFSAELKEFCKMHFKAALSTNRGTAIFEDIHELKRLSPAGKGKGENMEWMLLRGH